MNHWCRDADVAAGALLKEIAHSTTWKHIMDCIGALQHIRLVQVQMEEESCRFAVQNGNTFYGSRWMPSRPESGGTKEQP